MRYSDGHCSQYLTQTAFPSLYGPMTPPSYQLRVWWPMDLTPKWHHRGRLVHWSLYHTKVKRMDAVVRSKVAGGVCLISQKPNGA